MKKIIVSLIIILLTIIVCIITMISIKQPPKQEELSQNTQTKMEKYEAIKDYSEFFTVTSCINKYYSYLISNSQNMEIIYNLLDEDYKEKKQITKNNIAEKVKLYEEEQSFSGREMYKLEKTDVITIYWVYGVTKEILANDIATANPSYIGVKLDKENMTFSIIPCSKEEFELIKQKIN